MLLVRKISMAKWQSDDVDGLSADAVTADLRTEQNRLSLWRVESTATVEEAVLALAAAWNRVDKMDVAWVPEEHVHAAGLTLSDTRGDTRVADLRDTHVDLENLNYARLGEFAEQVHTGFANGDCRRFGKQEVARLLAAAVNDHRLSLDDLADDVRTAVESAQRVQ